MKNNKKGFTLAELLIVVAIIAVLVAIAIPIFSSQANAAKDATDLANVRACYAEALSTFLTNGTTVGTSNTATSTSTFTAVGPHTTDTWKNAKIGGYQLTDGMTFTDGKAITFTFNASGVVTDIASAN